MVTYGFYDSINHDRLYNAEQFGSIFDGVIRDGIFMSIGTQFQVVPSEGMIVLVGIGRAWFNHTWILNDALLPLTIEQSEILLDRIDAIVIDVNSSQDVRANDIIIVKGTPSKTPARPDLINTSNHHQYPLAYISVKAGVTSIRAADITSVVGMDATPFVSGILETASITSLYNQWSDDYLVFAETWKAEWRKWYEAQANNFQNDYNIWKEEMKTWSDDYNKVITENESAFNTWFENYKTQNQSNADSWISGKDTEFQTWFASLKTSLEPDAATALAAKMADMEACCAQVKEFINNLTVNQTMTDVLYDNTGANILDSSGNAIMDEVKLVIK